jgi:Nucleotide modification associated domain 3
MKRASSLSNCGFDIENPAAGAVHRPRNYNIGFGTRMKLILSRKGFDASNGGCASPIFEDGTLCPLPIPDATSGIRYGDIRSYGGASIAPMVEQLTRGRIGANDRAHLDPDLCSDALPRRHGWRPIFGQAGAAAAHLARQQVGAGDLFAFFGWFRRADRGARGIRFVRGAPDLHVIYGWMQVGEVVSVTGDTALTMPWVAYHPHLSHARQYKRNTIFVANSKLDSLNLAMPGGGAFQHFRPELCLTVDDATRGRSLWKLPGWFLPTGRPALSRHGDRKRWRQRGDSLHLRTVPIGQEFVLDLDFYPEARGWLRSMLAAGDTDLGEALNSAVG